MAAKIPIYLDYAAATPMRPLVKRAMEPFFDKEFYNPSATYAAGRTARQHLEAARARVASTIGARPSEVIFTAGGTEANNLAIQGVMRRYPEYTVCTSAVEHESVLAPVERFDHSIIEVNASGLLDLESLEKAITDTTVLISVMYANNEVGTVQPIRAVVQLAETIRRARRKSGSMVPLYVHTDACQAANYLDVHVARLGVDMMTLNGGKIYGPKQSGILFVASHVQLEPLIYGGGQERGIRSGTENVAQAVGFSVALEKAQKIRREAARKTTELQNYFMDELEKVFPDCVINGSRTHRLPNNVHSTFPGQDNERLIFALDEVGVMAAAGSACSASNEEPSHVLRAMGVSEADAQASLRFTLGHETTKEHITFTVQALADIVRKSVY